jgi:hypothetical protein
VFAKQDGRAEPGLIEETFEDALALDQWQVPEVVAFQEEQVEGEKYHFVPRPSGERGLELGQVGAAVLHNDYPPVEDRGFEGEVERAGDGREALRPVDALGV